MVLTLVTFPLWLFLVLGTSLSPLAGCDSGSGTRSSKAVASARATRTTAQNVPSEDEAIPVKVARVSRESIASYLRGTATLESEETVQILAEAAGQVTALSVEEGDAVQHGQMLAQLDDREARLALARTRVELAEARQAYTSLGRLDQREAELALHNAELKFEEVQEHYRKTVEMASRGLMSQQELDAARTQKETAEVELQQARVRLQYKTIDDARFRYERARTALQEAKLRLQFTTVQAPIAGVISQRHVARGQFVQKNQHLFTIVDTSRLLARTFLPEKFSGSVKLGQTAYVEVEARPQKRFPARVKLISPVVEAESGTFKVTVELTRPPPALKPGMFASVLITVATHADALVIPKRALTLDSTRPTVYRLRHGRVRRIALTVGLTDNERIEVLSGLAEGEQVVVIGQDKLLDDTVVHVVADED